MDTVRRHFVLPKGLAEEFELAVGERRQSEKISELIRDWLATRRMRQALDALQDEGPHAASAWDESGIEEWVRSERSNWERELPTPSGA